MDTIDPNQKASRIIGTLFPISREAEG